MLADPYFPFFNPYLLACERSSVLYGLRPTLQRVALVAPLLSFAEARLHLKLDPLPVKPDGTLMTDAEVPAHPDDSLVKALVLAAQAELDGPNSWTHRGVAHQRWRLALRGFPAGPITLPLPPLRAVESISYRLADGTREDVSADQYTVTVSEQSPYTLLYLNPGSVWPDLPIYEPAGRLYDDAVHITFTTGYEDGHPDLELVKSYAKLRLGQLYENREGVVTGTSVAVLPFWESMLDNLRVQSPDFLL